MATIDQIDMNRVPRHVAIIMDGNGRWAKAQGRDRSEGHRAGVDALHTMLEAANKLGIRYVTCYTFSTENWNRPQKEIDALMYLIGFAVQRETQNLLDHDISLKVIGDMDRLPASARQALDDCIAKTAHCKYGSLILAISYSSRWEITRMAQRLAHDVAAGRITPDQVDEQAVSQRLCTDGIPDPELLIRTGGEQRISNYLLWQIAYSELYFTDIYWPDFGEAELFDAIVDYQSRERRFGKTSAQVQAENK
ncbi:MAG: di-trans,poly-cis-decaprenylcistransferase [Bacteroidales bacterium]|nr:di-trans,poly-cis-decaprenylcistransferase [Candidatus Liminaster caballi]